MAFASILLLSFLVVMLVVTLIVSSWMLSQFFKLPITDEDKKSGSYNSVKWILISEVLISVAMLGAVGLVVLLTRDNKDEKKTILLISMISVSSLFTVMNMLMYFQFRNLKITDPTNSAYINLSNFVFVAPWIYLLFTVMIVVIWLFRRQLDACNEELKICEGYKTDVEGRKQSAREAQQAEKDLIKAQQEAQRLSKKAQEKRAEASRAPILVGDDTEEMEELKRPVKQEPKVFVESRAESERKAYQRALN